MTQRKRDALTLVLVFGLLALVAGTLGALTASPQQDDPWKNRPSTFFTDETGARGILLVMREFLPTVEPWRRPLSDLRFASDAPTTLVVINPAVSIATKDADALVDWVARGGQLILVSDDRWTIGASDEPDAGDDTDDWDYPYDSPEPQETGPLPIDENAATLLGRFGLGFQSLPDQFGQRDVPGSGYRQGLHELAVAPDGRRMKLRIRDRLQPTGPQLDKLATADDGWHPAAAVRHGAGRVVVIADGHFLDNASLAGADNAALLVTLAAGWGNGRVAFDEFHHGFGQGRSMPSLLAAFLATPWGWLTATLCVGGALYLFGYRRRFGRPAAAVEADRSGPLDLVDARGALFRTASARGLAVGAIAHHLACELGRGAGQAVDLELYARRARLSGEPPGFVDDLDRLVELQKRPPAQLTDGEVRFAGQAAARIIKEMGIE